MPPNPNPGPFAPQSFKSLIALAMFLLVLVLLVMRLVVIFKKLTKKVGVDVERVEDNNANKYMQRKNHQHGPYYSLPISPPQCSGSPALPLRMCSAPARLPSSKQLGELSLSFTETRFVMNTTIPISDVIKMGGPMFKYLDITVSWPIPVKR